MSKYTKRPVLDDEVCVHVMSRVVQRRYLMDERGMEEMRRILRTQAAFAGMEVITYCLLENHFHILLHVDPETARENVTDEELVKRFRALYGGKRSPSCGLDAEGLEILLEKDGVRAQEVRRRLKARMGDVSVFMRELKTRFSFWYNEQFGTVGTFWAERFSSVLVEPGSAALRAVAAYIDLNAVRAGLANSPEAYRFCGFGEAARGDDRARKSFMWLATSGRSAISGDQHVRNVYADYAAQLERILSRLQRSNAVSKASHWAANAPAAKNDNRLKGGALGSESWIARMLHPQGMFGFLGRVNHGLSVEILPGMKFAAARRWRSDRER